MILYLMIGLIVTIIIYIKFDMTLYNSDQSNFKKFTDWIVFLYISPILLLGWIILILKNKCIK